MTKFSDLQDKSRRNKFLSETRSEESVNDRGLNLFVGDNREFASPALAVALLGGGVES